MAKAAIVLTPSYAVAFMTEKMVYVVPTLAGASFIAASLQTPPNESETRLDEDGSETTAHDLDVADAD